MILCSWLFNLGISIANSSTSPWLPLLLCLVALLLSSAGLWGLWLSAQSLNSSNARTSSRSALQYLKTRWAFQRLPAIGLKLGLAAWLLATGWLLNDAWQYNHTFVLWDLKVMAEPGDQVLDPADGKIKAVPERTFYFQRASGPAGQMFPRTFCSKLVPGIHDGYTVEVLVGSVDMYPQNCWNIAPGPLGIVYNEGE